MLVNIDGGATRWITYPLEAKLVCCIYEIDSTLNVLYKMWSTGLACSLPKIHKIIIKVKFKNKHEA